MRHSVYKKAQKDYNGKLTITLFIFHSKKKYFAMIARSSTFILT